MVHGSAAPRESATSANESDVRPPFAHSTFLQLSKARRTASRAASSSTFDVPCAEKRYWIGNERQRSPAPDRTQPSSLSSHSSPFFGSHVVIRQYASAS